MGQRMRPLIEILEVSDASEYPMSLSYTTWNVIDGNGAIV